MRNSLTSEQEDLLIGCIKGMLEEQEAKLRRGQTKFRDNLMLKMMFRYANKMVIQTITSRIDGLLAEKDGHPLFWSYYELEKKEPSSYVFSAPDPDELMGAAQMLSGMPKPLLKAFEMMGAGGKDAMLKWLHGTITKELGVEEGGYKITVGE